MNLEFSVKNRVINRKGLASVLAHTANVDTFTIDFDSEWQDMVKLVVLQNGSNCVQLFYSGKTPLPAEVCGRGNLYVTCYGYSQKGDTVAQICTVPMIRPVTMGGVRPTAGNQIPTDTPSVFAQMAAITARAETAAKAAEEKLLELETKVREGAFLGQPGAAGAAATITIAETKVGEPKVENLGSKQNAVLRFTLPGPYVLTQEDKADILALMDADLSQAIGTGVLV